MPNSVPNSVPNPVPNPVGNPAGKGNGGSRVLEGRLSTSKIEIMASSRDGSFELQEYTRGCSASEFGLLLKKSLPLLSELMQSRGAERK